MLECAFVAVGIDAGLAGPVMLLQEVQEPRRVLPIWIGMPEAAALEIHRSGVPAARPSTHQLLVDMVAALGRRIAGVQITALEGTVFIAELALDGDLTVSARPSDAVTLAVLLHVPVFVEDTVLAEAGVEQDQVRGSAAEPDPQDVEKEVTEFRRILDDVDPEDFGKA